MSNKLISIIASGTNNYLTPSLSFNRLATDLVTPGVVGSFTALTGAYSVTAQGSPNMTVAVASGNAYVSATPTGGVLQTFGCTLDASENVTIASNSSGSTVYDFVYIKADAAKLNSPAVNGLDVITLVTSRSSTAYSTGAANGNSNGVQANCLLIAVVTVANNAVSIVAGNITDGRVQAGAAALSSTVPWTTYTPTVTLVGGGTNGNAVITGASQQISKTVHFWAKYVVGTTTTFAGLTGVTFSLPVTTSTAFASTATGDWARGVALISGGYYPISVIASTSTSAQVLALNTASTYLGGTGVTATIPAGWGVGSSWFITGTYEAA